jgi:SAM-dependent methyltransferase
LKLARKKGSYDGLTLARQKKIDDNQATFIFESGTETFKRLEIVLDRRGRAENLEVGERYTLSLSRPEVFFQAYETSSIPALKKGRGEPDQISKQRMEFFKKGALSGKSRWILDCATGIKSYLKDFAENGVQLVCLNLSLPMLNRTREWLDYEDAFFLRYNSDLGFPLKDNSFDTVVVDALLEYTKNPSSVLKKCSSLVKPGGRLLLLEPISSGKYITSLVKPGGRLLLLEPISSGKYIRFYPQDLWELAIWRPFPETSFSRKAFEDILVTEGFKLVDRTDMEFIHPIFSNEKFFQSAGVFKKLFIS